METFKYLIHKGGEESQSRSSIKKRRCTLIKHHKLAFDRSKAKGVNAAVRRCATLSVHAARLGAHSCAYPSVCDVLIQASLVIRDLTLRVFAITRFRGGGSREKIVQ
jgi:hypothetical protein